MPAPPLRSAVSGTPSRATANTGFGALWDYVTGLLGSTGNQAEAQTALGGTTTGRALFTAATQAAGRTAIGADVYKTLPNAGANLVTGEVYVATAGFTLNTGLAAGNTYVIYNNSAASITLTQGSGVTLRRAGTSLTGNCTLEQRGMATLWCLSTTEYIIGGNV